MAYPWCTLVLTLCTIPMLNFAIYVANRPARYSQVISHRGNGFGYPENTISAVKASLYNGYWVEIDVRISSDATPHLMHDATVDRTTRCTGDIVTMSDAALSRCGVPTLSQVLELGNGTLVLHSKTYATVEHTLRVVKNSNTEAEIKYFVDGDVEPSMVPLFGSSQVIWAVEALSVAQKLRPHVNFTKDMYGVSLQSLWSNSPLVRYVTQHSRNLDVWYTCDSGCLAAGNRWMSTGIPITHVEVDNPLTFESMDPSPSMMELIYRASAVGTVLAFAIGYHARSAGRSCWSDYRLLPAGEFWEMQKRNLQTFITGRPLEALQDHPPASRLML